MRTKEEKIIMWYKYNLGYPPVMLEIIRGDIWMGCMGVEWRCNDLYEPCGYCITDHQLIGYVLRIDDNPVNWKH